MNSLNVEKQYQYSKWAEIIKSCKSSGMKVSDWLRQNNISKDQYYYWQRKIKDACLESLQVEQPIFVELPTAIPESSNSLSVVKKVSVKSKSKSAFKDFIPVATFRLDKASKKSFTWKCSIIIACSSHNECKVRECKSA